MSKTTTIGVRVDPELKKSVEEILASLGLTTSQAINIYFHQILINDGIPFPIQRKSYNQTTIDALNEDLSDAKIYDSIHELYDELDIEP
jgi:DNA-damage-inducible protein J